MTITNQHFNTTFSRACWIRMIWVDCAMRLLASWACEGFDAVEHCELWVGLDLVAIGKKGCRVLRVFVRRRVWGNMGYCGGLARSILHIHINIYLEFYQCCVYRLICASRTPITKQGSWNSVLVPFACLQRAHITNQTFIPRLPLSIITNPTTTTIPPTNLPSSFCFSRECVPFVRTHASCMYFIWHVCMWVCTCVSDPFKISLVVRYMHIFKQLFTETTHANRMLI